MLVRETPAGAAGAAADGGGIMPAPLLPFPPSENEATTDGGVACISVSAKVVSAHSVATCSLLRWALLAAVAEGEDGEKEDVGSYILNKTRARSAAVAWVKK